MEIIGRKEEITKLKSYYGSGKPEFIALYGRRRVGKTYLVEPFCSLTNYLALIPKIHVF